MAVRELLGVLRSCHDSMNKTMLDNADACADITPYSCCSVNGGCDIYHPLDITRPLADAVL